MNQLPLFHTREKDYLSSNAPEHDNLTCSDLSPISNSKCDDNVFINARRSPNHITMQIKQAKSRVSTNVRAPTKAVCSLVDPNPYFSCPNDLRNPSLLQHSNPTISTDYLEYSKQKSAAKVSKTPAARPTLIRHAEHSLESVKNRKPCLLTEPSPSDGTENGTHRSNASVQVLGHKRMHTDVPSEHFQCIDCPFSSSHRQALLEHHSVVHWKKLALKTTDEETYHIEELPARDVLDKKQLSPVLTAYPSVSRRSSFGAHICPVCRQCFRTKLEYNYHKDRHDPRKPYLCNYPDCQRAFSSQKYLQNHMSDYHAKRKQYRCTMTNCSFIASRKKVLERHISDHHLGTFNLPSYTRRTIFVSRLKIVIFSL